MLREAQKDLGRLRRITTVLGKYGYAEWVKKSKDVLPADALGPANGAPPPERGPQRFREMLEELGPTFIKLGQVLSSRPDVVGAAYATELKRLQDHCEPLPFAAIEGALRAGLGGDWRELFAEISPVPLATASIAQVHRGRTRDGEEVVIKIQRPGIQQEVQADLDIMYQLARLLERVVEESALAEPVGVVREFDRALAQELDFRVEAANLREFKRLHEPRPDVVIPSVYPDLSSETVLTMSFLDGWPFSQLPDHADKKAIAERIIREAFDEVFIDGVFHADPHPGNILLLRDGRYGILDLGVLGRLSPQMRETIIVLALAIAVRDADTVARTMYRLGQSEERVNIGAVRNDTVALFQKYLNRSIKDVDSTVLTQELLAMAMRHKVRMPAEYTMLARAGATIEGTVRQFHPDIDIAQVATPYLERLLLDRVAPENVQGGMYKALLQFQGLSQDLPIQGAQILSDLASGNFTVNVAGRQIERLSNTILMSATVIAGAVLGAAFVVGTFIALGNTEWRVLGLPVAAIFGALTALTLVFWVSLYAAIRPRLKKISVLRLLPRKR